MRAVVITIRSQVLMSFRRNAAVTGVVDFLFGVKFPYSSLGRSKPELLLVGEQYTASEVV